MNPPATDAPDPKSPEPTSPDPKRPDSTVVEPTAVERKPAARPPLPAAPPDLLTGLVGARWPVPGPPPAWLVPAAAGAGAVGAVVLPFSDRMGLGVFLVALACAIPVAILARGRRGPGAWALGALAVGLSWVPVARDSLWLTGLCVLAATCLAVAALLDARTWVAVVGCMPTFPLCVVLAAPWLARAAYGRRRASAADPVTSAEAAARAAAARRRRSA